MVRTSGHASDWRAYAAAGVALALATSAAAQQPHTQRVTNHPATNQEAVPERQSANSAPPAPAPVNEAVSIQWNDNGGPKAPGDNGSVWQPADTAAILSAFAAIVLAVFAGVQLLIYGRQTKVMVKTAGAARHAAVAAGRSASAAERAIQKSDEILAHSKEVAAHDAEAEYRRERPYLFISAKENSFLRGPFAHRTTFYFKNSGRTIAFLKNVSAFFSTTEPTCAAPRGTVVQMANVDFVFGAGDEFPVCAFTFDQPQCFLMVSYVYTDIFSKPHFTRTIHRIDASKGVRDGAIMPVFENAYWNEWD